MKKFVLFLLVLLVIIPADFFAYANEDDFYAVGIPIIWGNGDIQTEVIDGVASDHSLKEKVVYVSIDDFCDKFNIQKYESDDEICLIRNTVKIVFNLSSNKSTLALGYDKNNIVKTFEISIPFKEYNGSCYISFLHGLTAFGIEYSSVGRDNIKNLFAIEDAISEGDAERRLEYLENNNIVDFNKYPHYLNIDSSEPYDKFFLMYDNNKSEYEFSYSNLPDFINHQTASWASYPSYYVNGFDSYTDLIIGGYQPEERYCDILLSIISNTDCEGEYKPESASLYTVLQWFDDYEEVREFAEDIPEFLSETLEYQGANAVFSYTLGSVTECVGVSEKYAEIKNCNQFQKNILDKTILDSNPITAEKAGGWALNQLRQITEMSVQPVKYVFRTIENATFDSTYALYESSETLNSQLQKPETNEVKEDISKIIYKKFTTGGDLIIDYMSEGTAAIPKVLIKSVRNTYPANQLLTASEKMGEVSDCYFIQKFIKSHDASSIFEDTEKNYYYTRLLLQTTLTAHEAFIENDALKFIIGEECSNIILERCDKIGELINKMSVSDISFYSTEGIPDGFGDINAVVYKYNKNSTDENTTAYTWQLEPSIEAEDIIVSDDSYDKYPLFKTEKTERPSDVYSIIQRNGQYALIDYDGQLYNDKFYEYYGMGDLGEIILGSSTPENIDSGNDIIVSYDQSGECKIDEVYVGGRGSAGWDSFYYDSGNKTVNVEGPGGPYEAFSNEVVIPYWGKSVNKAVLISDKREKEQNFLYGCYYNGNFTITPSFKKGSMSFCNDMLAFYNGKKWGYFNGQTGEQVIDFICDTSYAYTENLVVIYDNKRCAYFDTTGNEVIPFGTFEEVRPVHNGLAWVKSDGKWGIIQLLYNSTTVEDEVLIKNDSTSNDLIVNTVKLTDSDIKPEWTHVTYLDLEYPVFKTDNNKLQEFLDKSITQKILSYMGTDGFYGMSGEKTYTDIRITGQFEYDLSLEGYLSIYGSVNNIPIGAHGYPTNSYSFFVDLNNMKILELKDLFEESEDIVYTEIAAKADIYSKKLDYSDMIFKNAVLDYNYSDCDFMLDKNNLTVIFPPYAIAEWAAGTVKIEIPLSVIRLQSIVSGVETNTASNNKEYAEAYYDFLRNEIELDSSTSKFLLGYIDEDNIPELFVSSGNFHVAKVSLYSYYNGSISFIGEYGEYGDMFYSEKNNLFYGHWQNMGYSSFYVFKIENGSEFMIVSFHDNAAAVLDPVEIKYTIDDKEVNKKEYDEKIKQYKDGYQCLRVGYSNGFDINSDNLENLKEKPLLFVNTEDN